jgi:uncharacterized membrane protein
VIAEPPSRALSVLAWGCVALLTAVGVAAAIGRAIHPGDLTSRAEVVRERVFEALGLTDPLLAVRPAEIQRVDARFAAHPRATLLHVLPGGLFLVAAPLQFSSWIRRRHLRVHRWWGRVLVATAVVSVVPGLFFGLLVPYAGQPEAAVVGFFGGLLLLALARAIRAIRRGDVMRHREWMIRAYAVALGISTTRILGAALDLALSPAGFGPRGLFVLAIATGWGATVAAAELWIFLAPVTTRSGRPDREKPRSRER